eukprot:CAMPEP_0177616272 /NCGR_PEP_ID=MMETSP0419_2-20121207/24032_1 /TAXON_ID=582737 /ORGANISM="Tetraselmis sp., Strain GSL018" /LENGTH=133 /DNA_ID=CAMNT_0019114249 /DNA_START=2794 /DNA_END=3195 /DNA_ORIENTATION=+
MPTVLSEWAPTVQLLEVVLDRRDDGTCGLQVDFTPVLVKDAAVHNLLVDLRRELPKATVRGVRLLQHVGAAEPLEVHRELRLSRGNVMGDEAVENLAVKRRPKDGRVAESDTQRAKQLVDLSFDYLPESRGFL